MTDDLHESLAAFDNGDPITAAELEHLIARDGQSEAEAPVGWEGAFRLDTDRMAAWAMRKRSEAQARISEAQAVAGAERQRVDAWLHTTTATPERDVAFFDRLLTDYALREREQHDRKTLTTPHGTVKTTGVKATGKLRDSDALLAVLKAADRSDLITTVEVIPSLAELVTLGVIAMTDDGAVLTATGELLPAEVVEVTPSRVSTKVVT